MKNVKNNVKEAIFVSYIEGNKDLRSELDDKVEEQFSKFSEKLDDDTTDFEALTDLYYNAMQAGFYAGFNAAKELLIGK